MFVFVFVIVFVFVGAPTPFPPFPSHIHTGQELKLVNQKNVSEFVQEAEVMFSLPRHDNVGFCRGREGVWEKGGREGGEGGKEERSEKKVTERQANCYK